MSRPLIADPKQTQDAAAFQRRVFVKHGNACVFCGSRATDAMHVYPRAILGKHRYECAEQNGRPGCRRCHEAQERGEIKFPLRDRQLAARSLNAILKVKITEPCG